MNGGIERIHSRISRTVRRIRLRGVETAVTAWNWNPSVTARRVSNPSLQTIDPATWRVETVSRQRYRGGFRYRSTLRLAICGIRAGGIRALFSARHYQSRRLSTGLLRPDSSRVESGRSAVDRFRLRTNRTNPLRFRREGRAGSHARPPDTTRCCTSAARTVPGVRGVVTDGRPRIHPVTPPTGSLSRPGIARGGAAHTSCSRVPAAGHTARRDPSTPQVSARTERVSRSGPHRG